MQCGLTTLLRATTRVPSKLRPCPFACVFLRVELLVGRCVKPSYDCEHAAWAVRLGWFRVCVRTGVACVWFRAVCANVCVWYVVSEYAWCLARVSPGVSMKILK